MTVSRRLATPYVTTLDCECGGDYRLVQNNRVHVQDTSDPECPVYLMHQCIKCGKQIWIKNAEYPRQEMRFDQSSKEQLEEAPEVFDKEFCDELRKKIACTPVMDATNLPQ